MKYAGRKRKKEKFLWLEGIYDGVWILTGKYALGEKGEGQGGGGNWDLSSK